MTRIFALLCLACAPIVVSCAGTMPLPQHLQVSGVHELQERMEKARPAVHKYFAEARLTYFGPQGRVKGTASLAVARPMSLRYDIIGPHGGVMEAFATNGKELQLLNPGQERFLVGKASVANIDRLMAFAPLRLDPAGWVGLLFGEVEVPANAELTYDERVGRFVLRWQHAAGQKGQAPSELRVEVDPKSSRVTRAQIYREGKLTSDVVIESWDPRGLPQELRMKVPERDIDLEVVLRDIEHDPASLTGDTFALQPPRGIEAQSLDG